MGPLLFFLYILSFPKNPVSFFLEFRTLASEYPAFKQRIAAIQVGAIYFSAGSTMGLPVSR